MLNSPVNHGNMRIPLSSRERERGRERNGPPPTHVHYNVEGQALFNIAARRPSYWIFPRSSCSCPSLISPHSTPSFFFCRGNSPRVDDRN